MIVNMGIGGEGAAIIEHGGCEYLRVPAIFNVFSIIGSQWYILPPLPDLEPQHDTPGVEFEEAADEEEEPEPGPSKSGVAAAAPQPAPFVSMHPYAPKDGLGWIRDLLRQYALKPIDLNTDRGLRDSGKEGGRCPEGIAA